LKSAVLANLDLPLEVLEAVGKPKAEGPPAEPQQPGADEQPQELERGEEEQIPVQAPQEEEPAAAEVPIQEDWPASAKARIAQESEKRRRRTQEAEAWKQEAQKNALIAQQLHAQLQSASVPRPTEEQPLSDITDLGQLQYVKQINEQLEEFCDKHPNGAEDVVMGYDPQGKEILKDFTAEQIGERKAFAKRVLRQVPERAAYLVGVAQSAQAAAQLYPEMFQQGTAMNQAAMGILQQHPEIRHDPGFHLAIGDYLMGLTYRLQAMAAAQNGQRKGPGGQPLSAQAQAIFGQPDMRRAPAATRRGGPEPAGRSGGSGGAIEQAREDFEKGGYSAEGLEKLISAKLARSSAGQGRTGREPTLA